MTDQARRPEASQAGEALEARPKKTPHAIRPLAFVLALVLAPLVLAAPAFGLIWLFHQIGFEAQGLIVVLVIPVAAVLFGAIPYLLFGTPAFLLAVRKDFSAATAAFLANLAAAPFFFLVFLARQGAEDAWAVVGMMLFFGSIAAPIWGGFFGWLYPRLAGARHNA